MHNRLNRNDVTNRINVEDSGQVRNAVCALFRSRYPGADLIGQMSDRMYLEKCREFLYEEFVLGSIARDRINRKLGAADRYAEAHFDGPNLYQSEIVRNMHYLRDAIEYADLNRLRRTCYSLSRKTSKAA